METRGGLVYEVNKQWAAINSRSNNQREDSGMTTVVFVASHLGAMHGGINVFNAEIIAALQCYDDLRTVCLVPSADCVDASLSNTTIVLPLRSAGTSFLLPADDAVLAAKLLKDFGQIDAVVGHDVVTGDLALSVAELVEAKKILIHHMAYGRYISLMREPGSAREKERQQRQMFPKADQCFAVGPLLLDSLADIRRSSPGMAPPKVMLPPLVEVRPVTAPRNAPRILYSGRIEGGNDTVKQGRLAARAIGRGLQMLSEEVKDASVDIYGFDSGTSLVEEFREIIESEAGYHVPVKCLPFVDSRTEMLDVVKDSSLVVMFSVHEGFGLVAWEAMCCGVPLIVSDNSGFYQYVKSLGLAKFVDAELIRSHKNDDALDQQVEVLAKRIRSRIEFPIDAHQRAEKLLEGVRSHGGVKASLDEFVIACGYSAANLNGQLAKQPTAADSSRLLDVNLLIEVDVGLMDDSAVGYKCLTSIRRIQSAILALRSGIPGASVTVKSSYLDKLLQIAASDPDVDVRADAAVRYRVDQPKIEKLNKFFSDALAAIASPGFFDLEFSTDAERAEAFVLLVDGLNRRPSVAGKTYIDAVRFEPYESFSVWIPREVLEGKDFFEPIFTTSDGATLADLWFDCSSNIAAAYLRSCLAKCIETGLSPPPIGHLLQWRIGSH